MIKEKGQRKKERWKGQKRKKEKEGQRKKERWKRLKKENYRKRKIITKKNERKLQVNKKK